MNTTTAQPILEGRKVKTPEEKRAYRRKYYQDHKEEICEYNRRRNAQRKEEISARNKQYYQEHREERIQYVMEWEDKNRDHVREKDREWYQKHKDRVNRKRRQRYHAEKAKKQKTSMIV